jgi:transcription antitermination factor NusG
MEKRKESAEDKARRRMLKKASPEEQARILAAETAEVLNKPTDEMTIPELKAVLKRFQRKVSGVKAELVERVQDLQRRHTLGLPMYDAEIIKCDNMKWYMIAAASGCERSVERGINAGLNRGRFGNPSTVGRVFVPYLEGRKASVMPGYMLVEMKINQDAHDKIKGMAKVMSFVGQDLGSRNPRVQARGFIQPEAITDEEYESIVALTKDDPFDGGGFWGDGDSIGKKRFHEDDMVEVQEGPFKGMRGRVLEEPEKPQRGEEQQLNVLLPIMGQDTPINVSSGQCKKIFERLVD